MQAAFRRQKCSDDGLNRKTHMRADRRSNSLDNDDVGDSTRVRAGTAAISGSAFPGDIAQGQAAELPPGKRVEKGGGERRKETPPQGRDRLECNRPAARPCMPPPN